MFGVGIVCACVGAAAAWGLTWALSRTEASKRAHLEAPALAFVGSATLALFVLTAAFLVASSWQQRNAASDHTYQEARGLESAYVAAGALPPAQGQPTRRQLRAYVTEVNGPEWELMRHQEMSSRASGMLDGARLTASHAQGTSDPQKTAQETLATALDTVSTARNQRSSDMRWTVPDPIFYALIATALLVVLFPALVGINAGPRHMLVMILLGTVLGFGVYLVSSLQHSFNPPLGIEPDAYRQTLARFDQLDAST
ncbi:bestrophin-like domain [Streptomyces sp. NPDC001205]